MKRFLMNFWNYVQSGLQNEEFVIRAIHYIIVVSLASLFIIFWSLLIKRALVRWRSSRYTNKHALLLELVTHYLYAEDSRISFRAFSAMQQEVKSTFSSKILRDIILQLHRNVKGEIRDKLQILYLEIGMPQIALSRLKLGKWYEKADVIRELISFNLPTYYSEIARYGSDIHADVRHQVVRAGIVFNQESAFDFFSAEGPKSEWEIITYLDTIKNATGIKIPRFSKWLDQKDDAILVLCLRLIGEFQQYDAESAVSSLLERASHSVRLEAIRVCGKLQFHSALPVIANCTRHSNEPELRQTAILCLLQWNQASANMILLEALPGLCMKELVSIADYLSKEKSHSFHGSFAKIVASISEVSDYYQLEMQAQ